MSRYTTQPISEADYNKLLKDGISEADIVAYLIDECELNSWQQGAYPSFLTWCRNGGKLSAKQQWSIRLAISEFGLLDDEDKSYLKGFASREDTEVLNDKGPGSRKFGKDAAANQNEDDYDDDIPF